MRLLKILVLATALIAGPIILNSCSSNKNTHSRVKSKSGMGNPKDRNNGVWGR
ncbi:hypothetical protein [Acidiluteibacter ferrifornacis]|uniref:Lipoprotein n=1 Tax=Acidiluteibacter ferrifornacis TaxID=2692424 RepID=A0A6N9NJY5_9FLAO|nr:hypothetical protein [Acidiluteibacter ferrifornacis]NBG66998.1 hypothetical protein [Acidiluteibacter ferrifornacis]